MRISKIGDLCTRHSVDVKISLSPNERSDRAVAASAPVRAPSGLHGLRRMRPRYPP